jgi:hypothetical protein
MVGVSAMLADAGSEVVSTATDFGASRYRFGEQLGEGPREPKALFKATTEMAIHTPTTAMPSKMSTELSFA